ncbi:FKBP-type peptidyl-prolyl cis-trans isomerase [Nonomuraea typhae]|uniref:FKBP-type peptidyl-prolyl cis-trans isomerase n=1 Tax=Nonomuraea typhae TaxID=2603600 RepID=UPI0015E21B21|nr:FKBP-type peptidyl-prolyl cis-trans isomerase [Nonomuraea typhae]
MTGAFGTRPVITLPSGRPEPRAVVLSEGRGRVTQLGDVVVTDVEIRGWAGNESYLNTYDTGQPATVVLDGRPASRAWQQALTGRAAGSRVLLVTPAAEGFGPDGRPAGAGPADTLVIVFDILGGYPPDARQPGRSLPALPANLRPSERSRTLIDGSGPMVRPGAKIVVQYVGARWPSGAVFDSSHRRGGPGGFTLRPGAVPPGWVEALTGKAVGSRVAIAVPAAATRGFSATTGGIGVPAGNALVYVVDIIDAL